jgi:AcrR family transcriptional regulator
MAAAKKPRAGSARDRALVTKPAVTKRAAKQSSRGAKSTRASAAARAVPPSGPAKPAGTGTSRAESRATGTPRTESRADSRLPHLMEEAASLFAARGFEGASVRDIVGRVGMLPGSLYAHFGGKEALLLAVYEEGVRRIRAAVDAAIESETDPWARLEAACRAHLDNLLAKSAYAQVVIRVRPDDVPGVRERLVALRDGYEQVFRGLVARLPLPVGSDRRSLRLLLLGALNWSPEWYQAGGDSPRKIASGFIRLLR